MKVDFARLDRAFNPRCVVVVGDSKRNNFNWLRAERTFKGKLYSVQVNPETIADIKALGVENYTSLLEVPGPIDLVIIAVPREAVLKVLDDCIRKEVAAAHVFAAGFSETDTEKGIKLERQIAETAKQANFHLIGPNCFGIFNPKAGVRQSEEQYTDVSGPVGFISQSGNLALAFSLEAHLQGVDISKSVSFGNGVVLDCPDYLEYFGQDPEIEVIGMYLEGVRDSRRFLTVLKEVSTKKPVVVWKGGRSEAGGRAIASHTGSLSVPQAIWDAAVGQCGAMGVDSMEELIDTIKALLYLPPVRGDSVGVAGGSGGQSVIVADAFSEVGLRVPALTRGSYDELATFFSLIGGGCPNPIDTGGNVNRLEMRRIMRILGQDNNIDNLVLIVSSKPGWRPNPQQVETDLRIIEEIRRETAKPLLALVYFSTQDAEVEARQIILKVQELGIPAFPSIQRGALALKNALDYFSLKNGRSAA